MGCGILLIHGRARRGRLDVDGFSEVIEGKWKQRKRGRVRLVRACLELAPIETIRQLLD